MNDATDSSQFLRGIVEGYYGRSWSHRVRLEFAAAIRALGLNAALYCPKENAFLRRQWDKPFTAPMLRCLAETAAAYGDAGIAWGVGLSPFALYRRYGPGEREALRGKIEQITALGGSLLAILFDDMPGDTPQLAQRQGEIVNDIHIWAPGQRLLVCPTYYSHDPALERLFGAMPERYWEDLGRVLPTDTAVFWTGDQVCPARVSQQDIESIGQLLRRSVILWDNYPVNDSRSRSQHLYTRPLENRALRPESPLAGHLCNPMNQAFASLPALSGLAALYGGALPETVLDRFLGARGRSLLRRDGALFQDTGLEAIPAAQRDKLAREYAGLDSQLGKEVAGWLRGEYQFDPACLTD